ncbi:hypothetical protein ISU10_08250 [Nocardioides agariphilus]|jgi:hypothetical protein|uniref:Uncharacterized protein n=1 Tax=Nocardioides agariphilus TaxID=433664 RepID=A0A930YGN2_9ACTN|nr:hypothetical protein [Nocardioides agariphilus]MBF4767756.1 hypothetical protein [Nocardioides agariphilus]
MLGYEKVNKRRVERRVVETLPVGDHLIAPGKQKKRPKARRRLVDFSAIAAEPPAVSIAREREIVANLGLRQDRAS